MEFFYLVVLRLITLSLVGIPQWQVHNKLSEGAKIILVLTKINSVTSTMIFPRTSKRVLKKLMLRLDQFLESYLSPSQGSDR